MPQISVARLFDDNRAELGLAWVQGDRETCPMLDSSLIRDSSKGLTGHLNLIHPSWIQIFSHTEASYLQSLGEDARRKVLEDLYPARVDEIQVPGQPLAGVLDERRVEHRTRLAIALNPGEPKLR